ncbi:MAG TPA: zf-HC2 domain-containing protein [Vicinamibacterales bacterium]
MCDERERLIGYVYDECDPAERRVIEEHLEDCGTCRAEIGGLRSVRQDLLAWDVPPHEAVWRPLAPAPVVPWYRQVPAWAMAAAAGVMFLVGAAGGVVTHALVPHDRAAAATVAALPLQMTPVGVTESQLSEVEKRLVQRLRDELSKRDVGPAAPAVVPAALRADRNAAPVNELISAIEQKQIDRLSTVYSDLMTQVGSVRKDVSWLKDYVATQGGGGGR